MNRVGLKAGKDSRYIFLPRSVKADPTTSGQAVVTSSSKCDSIEDRFELIKYVGNMSNKYLECVYSRSLIGLECYMSDKIRCHIHVVNRANASFRIYVMFRTAHNLDAIDSVSANNREFPVLVWIRQIPHHSRAIVTVVRLELLNSCDVFLTDAFEKDIPMTSESLWPIIYGKLRANLGSPGIEGSEVENQIVQGSTKVVDHFSNKNAKNLWQLNKRVVDDKVFDSVEISLGYDVFDTRMRDGFGSEFEIRHVFPSTI